MTSKKHELNVRSLATAEANVRIARVALDHVDDAIRRLEIGLSSTNAKATSDGVQNALRALESEIARLERVVHS